MFGTEPLNEAAFTLLREKDPKDALEILWEHYKYMRDHVHGDYPGKGHPDPDFLQARMRYLAYYRDEGYSIEQLCHLTKLDPMQVRLLLMTWDDEVKKPPALVGSRWWISWYETGEDPEVDPPGIISYGCSGQRVGGDNAHTICAVVDAFSVDQAKGIVMRAWPSDKEKEWRFAVPKPKDWKPNADRFG